jgi:hypothetical protein
MRFQNKRIKKTRDGGSTMIGRSNEKHEPTNIEKKNDN